ncbi:arginine--tRNA ligase [Caldalkalibacillus mannanilyticus]|uniref:arginine--tRNA ligase n=1 Tax=Caldalkalibacillus mannanilyticus TaxID=1418 RepID=UPI00046AF11E|nr:arginine--tRNA ligase [Caldalkalibacillus mannanilyticus]
MKQQVVHILSKVVDLPEDQLKQLVATPPSREQGDVAFPCFQLAKALRKAPPQIAQDLVEKLNTQDLASYAIEKIVNMGPYLNFFFDRQKYSAQLLSMNITELLQPAQVDHHPTVIVEYSSPNIAKDFKLYHIRSTMIGQALANTYSALGYQVERMNHLGDWGTQFGKLMAAYLKWGDDETIKANPISELVTLYVKFHEEAEKNPALEDEGRLWFKKLEEGDPEAVRLWQWFKDESLKEFSELYHLLGVEFDHYLGESFYSDKMDRVIQMLKEKGLLEESEGALVVRLDEQNIPPCIIQKSDGTSIYATRDLAAAIYREETFDPEKILYVVDQRQALHFQQVFSVLKKMGYEFAHDCEHLSFGIMKIEGEIGSTRKGKGLLLNDVLEHAVQKALDIIEEKNPSLEDKEEIAQAIGIGAIVFNDLKHHRTHEIDFKWEEAFNFEGKTGPYVQYTHARICSLLRRAGQAPTEIMPHSVFEKDHSWELLYALQQYPSVLVETTKKNDPSQIAKYLLDLCQLFNRFYAQERIIVEDIAEQNAKLVLSKKVADILKHGLSMLTIKAPEAI